MPNQPKADDSSSSDDLYDNYEKYKQKHKPEKPKRVQVEPVRSKSSAKGMTLVMMR